MPSFVSDIKRKRPLFFHILVFVLAQIAWLSLLGLWIYNYIKNLILLRMAEGQLPAQLNPRRPERHSESLGWRECRQHRRQLQRE